MIRTKKHLKQIALVAAHSSSHRFCTKIFPPMVIVSQKI